MSAGEKWVVLTKRRIAGMLAAARLPGHEGRRGDLNFSGKKCGGNASVSIARANGFLSKVTPLVPAIGIGARKGRNNGATLLLFFSFFRWVRLSEESFQGTPSAQQARVGRQQPVSAAKWADGSERRSSLLSLLPSPCFGMGLDRPRIEVTIGNQRLTLFEGSRAIQSWPCSTSKFGIGFTPGSYKTPIGGFEVKEKHGAAAPPGTIFKSRQPVGQWESGMGTSEDLVLTRILWLHGLEARNANTFERYIYIHGTNDEAGVGRPGSHGCVRMKNRHVIELFDQVAVGTPVWIGE